MTLDEAKKVCEQAWPKQDVTLRIKGSVHEVVAKDGLVLGRAFSWQAALRQAVEPLLKAKEKEMASAREAAEEDFRLFLTFLREYLVTEFAEWKKSREAKTGNQLPGGNPGGTEHGESKLVHLVR